MEVVREIGLFDAHCHPTDIMSETNKIGRMNAKALTIMATRDQDQDLVRQTAEHYRITHPNDLVENPDKRYVVPAFGWHPWFSYQIYDDQGDQSESKIDAKTHYRSVLTPIPEDDEFLDSLPAPRSLTACIRKLEERLEKFPLALVGEIGLDRSFRVPFGPFQCPPAPDEKSGNALMKVGGSKQGEHTPGSREGRPLTPYRVSIDHQKIVLKAQLQVAAKYQRAVSVHSVATHGVVFDLLQSLWKGNEKPSKSALKKQKKDTNYVANAEEEKTADKELPGYPQRICLHSYSGPPDALKQFLGPRVPADLYFSFSELINFGSHNSNKAIEVIRAIPDDKILIESDLHCAGKKMDEILEDIFQRVCEIKGWKYKHGAKQLRKNWHDFIFGIEE